MSYPKWKYHADKPAVIVGSPDEEAALGQGWAESPADVKKSEPRSEETPKPAASESAHAPVKRKRGKHA